MNDYDSDSLMSEAESPPVRGLRAGNERAAGRSKKSSAESSPRKISRTDVNFWLDLSLLIVFLVLVFVTVVVRFIFPSVEDADKWSLWSWTMTQWIDAQFVVLCLLSLGILLHLMLHWTWICGVLTQRILPRKGKKQNWDDGMRTIFGVGLMIVILNILGGLIAIAALTIRHP